MSSTRWSNITLKDSEVKVQQSMPVDVEKKSRNENGIKPAPGPRKERNVLVRREESALVEDCL
jgi:hypothetical protein